MVVVDGDGGLVAVAGGLCRGALLGAEGMHHAGRCMVVLNGAGCLRESRLK
jgi:hypothetical protein